MTKKIVEWKAKRYSTKGMFGARCGLCLHEKADGGPRLGRGLLRRDGPNIWRIHCTMHALKAGCPNRLLHPRVKVKSSDSSKGAK